MTYWIIHITLLTLLSYASFRLLKDQISPVIFWLGLGLKLIAGIVLGFIFYEYYGTGDTITFFELAKTSNSDLSNQPRTAFFVWLIRPLVQLAGGSYWITSLWLSFISFIACWRAVITLTHLFPKIKNLIITCLLFIPSAVFWSSGVMKDSLTFGALALMVSVAIKLHRDSKISVSDVLIFLIGAFLLIQLKHYLFIVFLIFLGILLANLALRKVHGNIRWLIAICTLSILLGATQFIHPYLKINRIAWTLYENNNAIHQNSAGNSLDIVIQDDSWRSVLSQIPKSLHAGLFRPSILDSTPTWGWIHKIENLLLTFLIMLSLMLWFKVKPILDWSLLMASIISILLLAAILPLSTPNFGTLVRYKNAFFPFILLLSSILPFQYIYSNSNE